MATIVTASIAGADGTEAKYDRSDIERSFEAHAQETLSTLVEDGVLPSADLDRFDTDTVLPVGKFATASTGTTIVSADERGVSVTSLRTKARTDSGFVTLVVEPGRERSYALSHSNNAEKPQLYVPEEDGGYRVTEDDISPEVDCLDEQCGLVECLAEQEICVPVLGCYTHYPCQCGCP